MNGKAGLTTAMFDAEDALREVWCAARADPLARLSALRARAPEQLARAAAELFEARERAQGKLPFPERWWLTRRGLEQASHQVVARWRAEEFVQRVGEAPRVLDATCGVGMDAVALAATGAWVVAADRDPLLAVFAARNLHAFGVEQRVLVADAVRPACALPYLLVDPDRRSEAKRELDPERWSPRWSELAPELARVRGACVKLAPSTEPDDLVLPDGVSREATFVGRGRELAEVCLWTGDLAVGPGRRCVVVLGAESPLATVAAAGPEPELTPLGAEALDRLAWIALPHPALVRARLLGAASVGAAAPLGPGLAWLGCAAPERPTLGAPLWTLRRVLDQAPADARRVRRMLAERDIGAVRVRTRGHPVPAAELERRLRRAGGRTAELLVARTGHGQRAFLVEPG